MTTRELATILGRNYCHPPSGRKTTEIHLFGIRFADQLARVSIREVLELAEMSPKYATEISKGMALAPFVEAR